MLTADEARKIVASKRVTPNEEVNRALAICEKEIRSTSKMGYNFVVVDIPILGPATSKLVITALKAAGYKVKTIISSIIRIEW